MHARGLYRRYAVAIATSLCAIAATASTLFFGPKTYTLQAGQPQTFRESLALSDAQTCDGRAAFILTVQNGNGATTSTVDSATLALNGVPLLDESSFNPTQTTIEIPIRLVLSNTLQLTLKGGHPGATLTITIHRQIEEPVASSAQDTLAAKQQTFTQNLTIPDPTSNFALVVQNGDDSGLHATHAFSLAVNGSSIATERDLTRLVKVLRKAITLQANNTITVDASGAIGDFLTVTIKRELDESVCGPHVFFSTPAENAVVTTPQLTVTGTATGTKDLGITVNAHVANVDLAHAGTPTDPFLWFAVIDNLNAGPITLNAIAKNGSGGMGTASRAITFAPQPEVVSIRPLITAAVAPSVAAFAVTTADQAPSMTSYSIDFNGDSVPDLTTGTLPDPLTYNYTKPGIYRVLLNATGADGVTYSSATLIAIQSPAAIDAAVQTRWSQLRAALAAQNVDAAVHLFAPAAQQRYRGIYNNLYARLPGIAAGMSPARAIAIQSDYADYLVTRVENGTTMGYHLSMIRDADGVWKIADF